MRAVTFVVIFSIIMLLLGHVFVPKTSNPDSGIRNANARGFYGEPKNSIDVLILGDSNAYSACSPLFMWNEYGMTSYVAAEGHQSIAGALSIYEEVLTCQSPKVVVLDVNMLWAGKSFSKKLENNFKKLIYKYLPLAQYHDRWKTMKLSDIFGEKQYTYQSDSRGQYMSTDVKPYTGENKMVQTDDLENMPLVSRFFLERLISKCKQEGASLIFIETPTAKSWNYARHNAMSVYAKEQGIPFLDMNLLPPDYTIDWQLETRDGGSHLNCSGARKVSAYLGTYLADNFTFTDKRTNPAFSRWNDDYEKYKDIL